jgi:hypothetical protein
MLEAIPRLLQNPSTPSSQGNLTTRIQEAHPGGPPRHNGGFFNPYPSSSVMLYIPRGESITPTGWNALTDLALSTCINSSLVSDSDASSSSATLLEIAQELGGKKLVERMKVVFKKHLILSKDTVAEFETLFQKRLTFISTLPEPLQHLRPQLFVALVKQIPHSSSSNVQYHAYHCAIEKAKATFPINDPTKLNDLAKILIGIGNLVSYSDCLELNNTLNLDQKRAILRDIARQGNNESYKGHWAKEQLIAFAKKPAKSLNEPCVVEIKKPSLGERILGIFKGKVYRIDLREHRGKSDWLKSEPLSNEKLWGDLQEKHQCLVLPPGENIELPATWKDLRDVPECLALPPDQNIETNREDVRFEVICEDTIARRRTSPEYNVHAKLPSYI